MNGLQLPNVPGGVPILGQPEQPVCVFLGMDLPGPDGLALLRTAVGIPLELIRPKPVTTQERQVQLAAQFQQQLHVTVQQLMGGYAQQLAERDRQ